MYSTRGSTTDLLLHCTADSSSSTRVVTITFSLLAGGDALEELVLQ